MTTEIPPRRSRRRLIVILALAAAVVVAAGVVTIILLTNRHDEDRPPVAEADLWNCQTNGGRAEVAVYFNGETANADMRSAADSLRGNSMIDATRTETRQEAFEHFQKIFKDQPELLKIARPEALPAGIFVLPPFGIKAEDLATRLRTQLPAADDIKTNQCPPTLPM